MNLSQGISMSTTRVREILKEIDERDSDLNICPAVDVPGPGGGVYITRATPLNLKHVEWMETRSPARGETTYVDVRFVRGDPVSGREVPEPEEISGRDEKVPDRAAREKKASEYSKALGEAAQRVSRQAEAVQRSLGSADFSVADLRKPDTDASLRQFERSFADFHGSVKKALDEYLRGNTLVMDLILKFQLDKDTVRHALSVAAFATEMATLLALRDEDDTSLEKYFEGTGMAEILTDLGLDPTTAGDLTEEEREAHRFELFRTELVEIFLGGFMHDCGLWTDTFLLAEGHEVKGAKVISETKEVRRFAPSLEKIVLFHSDLIRLSRKQGVLQVIENADNPEQLQFRREFYDDLDEAQAAAELHAGQSQAEVLNGADLRKLLPVALAEYFISQTRDIYDKSDVEVINDLVQHARGGLFQRYLVVLCNSRVDLIAPRRALVTLSGHLSMMVEGGRGPNRRDGRRAQRLAVDGFDAGSLMHGRDRNSPHLITLFQRRGDGSRAPLQHVLPHDHSLWERAAGREHRMYIAAGRFRNNLSFRVTGFMSEAVYARILGDYETELDRRLSG
ncbi:MAG: hypothetical protein HN712_10775 [Gemmatimonadetes bacterium]|nr:hypothetical protein [Gemmatimonadota bacterium]MBT7860788.1 hypothetical protein [Gemmatimonadota bacterium]